MQTGLDIMNLEFCFQSSNTGLDICLGSSSLDILNMVFCPSPSPSPEYAGLNIDANRVGYFELGVLVFLPGYLDIWMLLLLLKPEHAGLEEEVT